MKVLYKRHEKAEKAKEKENEMEQGKEKERSKGKEKGKEREQRSCRSASPAARPIFCSNCALGYLLTAGEWEGDNLDFFTWGTIYE